jgi:hypothetical protein
MHPTTWLLLIGTLLMFVSTASAMMPFQRKNPC